MSVINKKPFIKSLLESLSEEDLTTLSALIDGGGDQTPLRRTANPIAPEHFPHISATDKGVHICHLTINFTVFIGYLVYNDDYCVLISFTDAQVLKMFDLTEDVTRPNTVDEAINVLELRTAVFETAHAGSGGGGGTQVVANPTLSGNEANLTGLEVAGTKYKVPSGGSTVPYDIDTVKGLLETIAFQDQETGEWPVYEHPVDVTFSIEGLTISEFNELWESFDPVFAQHLIAMMSEIDNEDFGTWHRNLAIVYELRGVITDVFEPTVENEDVTIFQSLSLDFMASLEMDDETGDYRVVSDLLTDTGFTFQSVYGTLRIKYTPPETPDPNPNVD